MSALGFAIYAACVDFMLHAAIVFGISYRDANTLLLLVIWPLVTIALASVVAVQGLLLRRRRRSC